MPFAGGPNLQEASTATIANMGWLELLAMMKRVLPLLGRLAPMLETYVAARGATQGDAGALDHLSADLQAQIAATAQNHVDLKDTLEAQSDRLQRLADEVRHLRTAESGLNVRLEYIEEQIASNVRLLRIAAVVAVTLLLACVGLLLTLLLRHGPG